MAEVWVVLEEEECCIIDGFGVCTGWEGGVQKESQVVDFLGWADETAVLINEKTFYLSKQHLGSQN